MKPETPPPPCCFLRTAAWLALLPSSAALAEPPLTPLSWPDTRIKVHVALDALPRPPAGPYFSAPESLILDAGGKLVRACARLSNPLPEAVGIRYFSANPAGPMILLPEEGAVLRRRPLAPGDVPLPPPAPPPPMRFDLPARSAVSFCAETSLVPFDFTPGSEARFRWHFEWKNPPAGHTAPLQGELTLRLP